MRCFLGQAEGGERAYALAESIIHMAHRLKLTVIAEAVETEEQLADLVAMGCDFGQGYYFDRPVSAERIAELLRAQGEATAAAAAEPAQLVA